jgi:hypothetical protein
MRKVPAVFFMKDPAADARTRRSLEAYCATCDEDD